MIIAKAALFTMVATASMFADPVVLFNNFGPGGSYDISASHEIGDEIVVNGIVAFPGESQAEAFTPSATAALDQAILELGNFLPPEGLIISLASDKDGHPGTVLESFSVSEPLTIAEAVTLDSTVHPLLTKGSTYWVVAAPISFLAIDEWWLNSTGGIGLHGLEFGGGDVWTITSDQQSAFEITGTPATAVPETSSSTMTLTAIGLMVVIRRTSFAKRFVPYRRNYLQTYLPRCVVPKSAAVEHV